MYVISFHNAQNSNMEAHYFCPWTYPDGSQLRIFIEKQGLARQSDQVSGFDRAESGLCEDLDRKAKGSAKLRIPLWCRFNNIIMHQNLEIIRLLWLELFFSCFHPRQPGKQNGAIEKLQTTIMFHRAITNINLFWNTLYLRSFCGVSFFLTDRVVLQQGQHAT